jgi:hypothetical protein
MLSIYFETEDAKNDFDKIAAGFGLSSSTLGMMCLRAGMRHGWEYISGDHRMVVNSASTDNRSKPPTPSILSDRLLGVFSRRSKKRK